MEKKKFFVVRQVASAIRKPKQQSLCLRGLGLRGIGSQRRLLDTRENRGMVQAVHHLVAVIEETKS